MAKDQRDEKLGRDSTEESVRGDREMQDRPITQNRELTDAQRLDMVRAQSLQAALPDLPVIPGFHNCWLTTTNPADPIHRRMSLGYTPIMAHEIPGWQHAAIKSGDWSGCIGVNEMLAFKLPNHLYQMYMRELHHDAPNREEEKLRAVVETIAEEAKRKGAKVQVGDGTAALGVNAPRPQFEGVG